MSSTVRFVDLLQQPERMFSAPHRMHAAAFTCSLDTASCDRHVEPDRASLTLVQVLSDTLYDTAFTLASILQVVTSILSLTEAAGQDISNEGTAITATVVSSIVVKSVEVLKQLRGITATYRMTTRSAAGVNHSLLMTIALVSPCSLHTVIFELLAPAAQTAPQLTCALTASVLFAHPVSSILTAWSHQQVFFYANSIVCT